MLQMASFTHHVVTIFPHAELGRAICCLGCHWISPPSVEWHLSSSRVFLTTARLQWASLYPTLGIRVRMSQTTFLQVTRISKMLARATLRKGSVSVPSLELCAEVGSIPFGRTPTFPRAFPFCPNSLQVYLFFFLSPITRQTPPPESGQLFWLKSCFSF